MWQRFRDSLVAFGLFTEKSSTITAAALAKPVQIPRSLQTGGDGDPEFVDLLPFDVVIALTANQGVDTVELTNVVEDWMDQGFRSFLNTQAALKYADFSQVVLVYQASRRSLLRTTTTTLERGLQVSTFLASYEGVSIWNKVNGLQVPDKTLVAAIQTSVLAQTDQRLLAMLQASNHTEAGLGEYVVDVDALLNNGGNSGGDDGGGSVDVLIIVAIVVAALAFVLLSTALFLAYRRKKQQDSSAYKVGGAGAAANSRRSGKRKKSRTEGESDSDIDGGDNRRSNGGVKYADSDVGAPSEIGGMSEIAGMSEMGGGVGGGLYPESMISEDISTSLTAYYKSGMGGEYKSGRRLGRSNSNGGMNDNASVSSMESYGYSLDGYQSSIAEPTTGYQADVLYETDTKGTDLDGDTTKPGDTEENIIEM